MQAHQNTCHSVSGEIGHGMHVHSSIAETIAITKLTNRTREAELRNVVFNWPAF